MAILQPYEYDISYFDGDKARLKHNAGYSSYERWYRTEGENSLGEYWKDYAKRLVDGHNLVGKKVLELGCAKGFIVEDMRDMGVDAYGMDVSAYAIGEASDKVKPYVTQGDAREDLKLLGDDEFDVVFSLRFLECIPEADIPALIAEINRVSKSQFHVVDDFTKNGKLGAGQYYLQHTQQEWLNNYSWAKGTKIIAQENRKSILIK